LALDEASTDKIDIQNQTSLTSYDSDKPATWLDAIKTFAKNGEAELALKEYTKFRKRYPEHEPDFRLNNFIPKEFKPLKSLSPDALTSDTQQNNTTD